MRNLFFLPILSVLLTEILGDIPGCDYFDTVDLTNSQKYENGSYQYEDVLITMEEVGEYDYQILYDGEKETVPKHTRGCVCKAKTCVRFCCHPQMLLLNGERSCENVNKILVYSTVLNITLNNGTQIEKNIMELMVQQHLPVPCSRHAYLDADYIQDHEWTLFENGSLLRHFDNKELSKRDYCMQPQSVEGNVYKLVPHHCIESPSVITSYIQMVSIFFMLLIIVAYLILPNFKGVHGKCCTCYFVCLTLSFMMLINVSFETVEPSQSFLCRLIGYTGYYTVISTFLWLLIINYNLWKTFNNIGVGRKSRFFHYNVFVWSVAAVLLVITGSVDLFFKDEESEYSPGFGINACWINTMDWSAMIYYYGPILLLLIFNITLFILTAMRILVQNRQNRRQLKKSEGQRNLRNLTNFGMFFRLFVIVGVIWILEIASYIWTFIDKTSTGLFFLDLLTSGQGVVLFAVTIIKKDILKSLVNRIRKRKPQNDSSITTTSHMPMTEVSLIPKAQKTDQ